MSKVASSKKQHRSMRGKSVDMDLLRKRNELTPAVGNARVNARGDELGPGGQIVKKREELVAEHYATANIQNQRTATPSMPEVQEEPTAPAAKKTSTRTKKQEVVIEEPLTVAEQEMLDEADTWVEDDNGNFIPKGE